METDHELVGVEVNVPWLRVLEVCEGDRSEPVYDGVPVRVGVGDPLRDTLKVSVMVSDRECAERVALKVGVGRQDGVRVPLPVPLPV